VKKLLTAAMMLALGVTSASAQSLEDLNIQIHGYATQGFIYTTQNNILTTSSSSGSPSWTEAVVNVSTQPIPKLRVAVQGRYFLLGNYGNSITLDWASADYKVSDRFGVRFGKVKTPNALFNETQDIDPSYMWSLLPESIYPISSRNSILAHNGGVIYGTVAPIKGLGKFEYRAYGGERVMSADDGFFLSIKESGANFTNGLSGPTWGGALHWRTPIKGLMLGVAMDREDPTGAVTIPAAGLSGYNLSSPFKIPYFYGTYERKRFMFASEYSRVAAQHRTALTSVPVSSTFQDQRQWYAMTTYKATDKLTTGIYYSSELDRKASFGPGRYQKDWAISGRYDFNQFLYAKAEQHFVDGTAIGYDTGLNPNGLKPDTRMTIFKIGVSF
jgi:hypothetical protein